ncbi:YitT family protein [Gymnodinialimonas sp. 2305UL16-5]|uniref:YitT family protein n=1 Tax=Gymnodinialimonas mytili TaxID=3126503 RepID=UPI003095C740
MTQSAAQGREPHLKTPHTWAEDALALILGASMCALGIHFLTHAGLITGQTAGLAVLITYLSGWSFGWVFFLVNIPFYLLALLRMGRAFVIKTVIGVAMLSAMTELAPQVFRIDYIAPGLAAFLAGATLGLGLLAMFRHGASLGGIGILAFYLQDRFNIRAGLVQLGFDAMLFAVAFAVLDPLLLAWSLMGAVIVNVIVAVNHRGDLYIGR